MSNKLSVINALQIRDLMHVPLEAAYETQQKLSKNTLDFINNTCLTETKDANGNITDINVRTVSMSFQDGTINKSLTIPLLSLLTLPSLNITQVEVDFSIAVNSISSDSSTLINNNNNSTNVNTNTNLNFRDVSSNISSQSSYNTSAYLASTNTNTNSLNATYNIHIKAESNIPIGLTKIIEILNSSNSITYSNNQ
jgi:hypothetical protein